MPGNLVKMGTLVKKESKAQLVLPVLKETGGETASLELLERGVKQDPLGKMAQMANLV